MDEFLKLPVGIDNFEKIRQNGFYYVDKTSLIEQLFSNWGEVNLFTRPRRFGKTLNMSMLKYFFEIGTDRSLFDGLHICANEKICSEHMGKYPVIFLSLKNAEGLNFDTAKYQMVELMMGFSSISFQKESVNYVIVLGAQVRGNKISRTLERRLDKAVEYAAYHPNTVFVLSGGQGDDEDVTEASAMYRYMKSRGVPDYQLLLEESSRSTYENMVYSKILITERERLRRATLRAAMAEYGYLLPPDEEITIRVGILTSNFHELRAKGIARHVGIPNVSGISAKSDPVLFAHFCVRECFAILKDKFVGNM